MTDPYVRRRFRIAVGVSVGLHALAALVVLVLAVWGPPPPSHPPAELADTAAAEDDGDDLPPFTLTERTTQVQAAVTSPPPPHPDPTPAPSPAPSEAVAVGRPPVAVPVPPPLSSDVSNLIRDLANRPAARLPVQDVTDVTQVQHAEPSVPVPVTDVTPAAAAKSDATQGPVAPTPAPAFGGKGKPLHGRMPEGKTVVYVLDRSSSMRLSADTFDAARGAVLASLHALPSEARFQVVVYSGAADLLLAGTRGELLTADEPTRTRVGKALAELSAEGRSVHTTGLQAALALKADYILFVTDADESELAELKPLLKAAAKPTAVYVGRASGGKVDKPEPLR